MQCAPCSSLDRLEAREVAHRRQHARHDLQKDAGNDGQQKREENPIA